ncbi:glycolipid transfer protein 3 [Cajanus cajan]|uniref:Pleckstrin isogenyy domain-containing family A member 8 n=1 Tax=Cajanus cajan TaxID=3821 RepID=A0A151SZ88_CAJCA|nr:glycolipid transfer protein 3 [Cajanus cajan]KYP60041.1 Pleckstrin isogenyy domain-containing family A member 8 [Cajanus cajan]
MKRSREMKKSSEINSAIEELSMLAVVKPGGNHEIAHIPTRPFLSLCYFILQVLDKIGPTMAVLRQDVHQNIKRLELMHEMDPSMNSNLVEILKSEASKGKARKRSSCSKAFLWLTRSLDFSSALLETLENDPKKNMEQIVQEAYDATLSPWHGWISSAAFRVAVKLVPDSKTFMDLLMEKDENCDTLKEKMQILVSLLVPFLEDVHSIFKVYNLDRIKST